LAYRQCYLSIAALLKFEVLATSPPANCRSTKVRRRQPAPGSRMPLAETLRRLVRLGECPGAVAAETTRQPVVIQFVDTDMTATNTVNVGTGIRTHFNSEHGSCPAGWRFAKNARPSFRSRPARWKGFERKCFRSEEWQARACKCSVHAATSLRDPSSTPGKGKFDVDSTCTRRTDSVSTWICRDLSFGTRDSVCTTVRVDRQWTSDAGSVNLCARRFERLGSFLIPSHRAVHGAFQARAVRTNFSAGSATFNSHVSGRQSLRKGASAEKTCRGFSAQTSLVRSGDSGGGLMATTSKLH